MEIVISAEEVVIDGAFFRGWVWTWTHVLHKVSAVMRLKDGLLLERMSAC